MVPNPTEPPSGLQALETDTFLCRRVCAITIYRVQATSTIGDPTDLHAQDTYCLIALLSSLEALLGVISACLPLLGPIFRKLRDSQSERRSHTIISSRSHRIPFVVRKSDIPTSSSRKQYSSESTSTTDSIWNGTEVEAKCARQDSPRPISDRVTEIRIPGMSHLRDADAKSLVSHV